MKTIPHYVCGVIPLHMLARVAERTKGRAAQDARATIEHMRELASGRAHTAEVTGAAVLPATATNVRKVRHVYDARHRFELSRKLVRSEGSRGSKDRVVNESYDGAGATHDFYARVFHRNSIDGAGMRLDSTVHYGRRFANAMWNGEQVVYGDGDGRIFNRFTRSLDVIGHEQTHGVTQSTAALGYSGQTGALNEHLSDAFGTMIKQYTLGLRVHESDWLIGAELMGPDVNGVAIRSMAAPGFAYDDPVLGRDPQPRHMRGYVETDEDNGGVHINSGILNYAFFLAATRLGGKSWEVLGRVWYAVVIGRLGADDTFADFTRATVEVAAELYGPGSIVQQIIISSWRDVGLVVPGAGPRIPVSRQRIQVPAIAAGSLPAVPPSPHPPLTTLLTKEKAMSNEFKEFINLISKNRKSIDRSVRMMTAEQENENILAPATALTYLSRVVKGYRHIKPLLELVASFKLLPTNWRAVIASFSQSVDELAGSASQLTLVRTPSQSLAAPAESDEFKAGKDL